MEDRDSSDDDDDDDSSSDEDVDLADTLGFVEAESSRKSGKACFYLIVFLRSRLSVVTFYPVQPVADPPPCYVTGVVVYEIQILRNSG